MASREIVPFVIGRENTVTLIGIFKPSNMAKSPEQRILELEAKVNLLEK